MNLIVAADENWGIGREGQLLFHISPDLKNFKALTLHGTVIMGRKTLESLPGGRPLKNRVNIVLSRTLEERTGGEAGAAGMTGLTGLTASGGASPQNASAETEWLLVCRDLAQLKERLAGLEQYPADEDVWGIGGAQVYRELLPCCRYAYVTRVAASRPADVFFADLEREPGWRLVKKGEPRQWEGLSFRFDLFENEAPREL